MLLVHTFVDNLVYTYADEPIGGQNASHPRTSKTP
jgi:hypothetical protein